jgi:uncharacterized protein (UPF0212 family)
VIDVDLAGNAIIVKEGHSGIYQIAMQCEGEMTNSADGGSTGNIAIKNGVATLVDWQLTHADFDIGSSGNPWCHNHSAAMEMVFIDASGGDVTLDVDWTAGTAGGSCVLRLKQFSVTCVGLSQSYDTL